MPAPSCWSSICSSIGVHTLTNATTLKATSDAKGEAIFQAIKGFLEDHASLGLGGSVELSTPLMNSQLDSLTVLQLMIFLSDELQFELQEDDFGEEHFGTVGALVARILERRGAA
jgi:acyl carrier protein